MRILCEHALVNGTWCRRVAIDIAPDGSIAAVEPAAANDEGERLSGFVLPGMVDVHNHATGRVLAGLGVAAAGAASGQRARWLERRMIERIGPEELWAVAAATYIELLHAGCTSVVAFHDLHHAPDGAPYDDPGLLALALHEAAREAGIGLTLLVAGRLTGDWDGRPLEGAERRAFLSPDGALRILERLERVFGDDPDRRLGLGIPSLRHVPRSRLPELVALAGERDPHAPIHIQLAETADEVLRCRSVHGAGPLAVLRRQVGIDARWCLLHAAPLDAEERAALRSIDAVVGLLPESECRYWAGLGDLAADAPKIALGSDRGAVLAPTAQLRMLRATAATQGVAVAAAGLLARVLAGGAQASGRAVGRLAPGFRADLVHLDADHPLLAGATPEEVIGIWVDTGSRQPFVRDVMVGGHWQIRGGRHTAAEPAMQGLRWARERLLRDGA